MKLQYFAVLAAVFACANADAATKKARPCDRQTGDAIQHLGNTPLHLGEEDAGLDQYTNFGSTPLIVAVQKIDVIANAIQGYVDKFHTIPPLRHQELFPLLDGQNPQKYRFLYLERFRTNAQGEVIDPWKVPFRIEKQGERIIVASRKMHYVRVVNLSKLPAKSIANHPSN